MMLPPSTYQAAPATRTSGSSANRVGRSQRRRDGAARSAAGATGATGALLSRSASGAAAGRTSSARSARRTSAWSSAGRPSGAGRCNGVTLGIFELHGGRSGPPLPAHVLFHLQQSARHGVELGGLDPLRHYPVGLGAELLDLGQHRLARAAWGPAAGEPVGRPGLE